MDLNGVLVDFLSLFVILLYIEMYGFPLTTFILIWFIGDVPGFIQGFHLFGKIGGYTGQSLVLIGGLLVLAGWCDVYNGPPDTLQTKGLYSYVRHPQYMGILLVTFGLLIHWVTIILSVLFPILIFLYYHLAKTEENYLKEKLGEQFIQYKNTVPMFIPRFRRRNPSEQ
jgi:protein-S-isoprenylcysteine O-methyltransferase Ste14